MHEAYAGQPVIAPVDESTRAGFDRLMAEYLPGNDPQQIRAHAQAYPEACLALTCGDTVSGIAFGWPRRLCDPSDTSLMLSGLAVAQEARRRGFGRMLLNRFSRAAARYRCDAVSVGSAPGYAEKFYIACGFVPVEYKVWTDKGPRAVKQYSGMEDYRMWQRPAQDGFVVLSHRCDEARCRI